MNQQSYDLILTIALFMCGLLGLTHYSQGNSTQLFGFASMTVLLCAIGYMFVIPKYLSLPDRSQFKHMAQFFCELCQKIAMLAVVAQCFIILAST